MQRCLLHSCYSPSACAAQTHDPPHSITLLPSAMSISSTRAFILYLLTAFSIAVLSALFLTQTNDYHNKPPSLSLPLNSLSESSTDKIWPELKASWRLALATVIGFLGSAFGTVGGVGGGGIFVPMLTLVLGFDTKSAAALSKCMIMGASTSSVFYNLRVRHPTKEVPILDYNLALLFQPMLMLGITVGVALSVVFPYWLITVLIIILFIGTSSRSFYKATEMWKEETLLKKEMAKAQTTFVNSRGELLIDTEYDPLVPREEKTPMQIFCFNLNWKRILVLMVVWVSFLLLQIIKNDVKVCSVWYWVLFSLQFPIALVVFGYEAVKLYKDHKKRMCTGNSETICEASIEWTVLHIVFCALCGILGGTVGGLLGSGGGFILGPLLIEIGVIPQVASATATFVMMFSSSLSVVEFYLLKRFPIPYAIYLFTVSVFAGFVGQLYVRKLIRVLGRASIIVFILSGVIFASALTMGAVETSSLKSGGCGKDEAGNCSQTTTIYGSQLSSLVENGGNVKRENSVSTGYSKRPNEANKSNRKRLKPGENPRPRPKDRQMIQDRVKELREIVPNGGKIISKEDGLLLKDNFEGGATWAYEVGSQSMVCPIIVEDLNPPRQMLVEMLCEERGFFLEIADLIRGLGLTILKGKMEVHNDKIWARFAVEANRDVTRMEIFMSLLLNNFTKDAYPPEVYAEVHHQFSAGMQTVAVIPVLPHGVVQLGSFLPIMENMGFVKDVQSFILQLGCIPGALLSEDYSAKLSNGKFMRDYGGIW